MSFSEEYAHYFDVPPASELELAELTQSGVETDRIGRLREQGLTFAEVGNLVISARTLKHRRARGERLSREETDRLLRVVRVLAFASHVFGEQAKAVRWLRMEDDRLHGRAPLQLLATEAGGRVVEGLLWQIDEGVYA